MMCNPFRRPGGFGRRVFLFSCLYLAFTYRIRIIVSLYAVVYLQGTLAIFFALSVSFVPIIWVVVPFVNRYFLFLLTLSPFYDILKTTKGGDTLNERLKALRSALGITLEEFGKRVGVTRSAIGRIEKGDRKLTEQMALSICREFRVNYYWLTEGKGEMFSGTPQNVVDEIAEDYNLDDIDKKIIEVYLELSADDREVIKKYLKNIFT